MAIKLKALLSEIEKGKWVDLDSNEVPEYSEDIYDLIRNAYASIGGHPNFNNPSDVMSKDAADSYEVIDLDSDPDIDAVSASKTKPAGNKFVATGHDGSKPAKSAVVNHKATELKKRGNFIEVSGKIKDILIAKGVPVITDKDVIRRVLKGKEIEFVGDEGEYRRKIGGQMHTKILLGNPK